MNELIQIGYSGHTPELDCKPYNLIIGVICGSVAQIKPLLSDIKVISRQSFIKSLKVVILANGVTEESIHTAASEIFKGENKSCFEIIKSDNNRTILPIGRARTLLQKSIGIIMQNLDNTICWILDDDMRIPDSAKQYLTWLPRFKADGVDVLIGNFAGGSPNPPLHGVRCQLNDLLCNLRWLTELPIDSQLPDRKVENDINRDKYPDFYYDLSRKHQEHLVVAFWVEPSEQLLTVHQALEFLWTNIHRILTGEPFLRPLKIHLPADPLLESRPSCNRGGNTIIFNSAAMTETPNAILMKNGKESRRSDMVWAIINKYKKAMDIRAVNFPVYHHRFIDVNTDLNIEKTVAEIKGAALYAALTSIYDENQDPGEIDSLALLNKVEEYISRRMGLYEENFAINRELIDTIISEFPQFSRLTVYPLMKIKSLFSDEILTQISGNCEDITVIDIDEFLTSCGLT